MHGGRLHVGGRIQRTEGLMRVSRRRKKRSAEASDSVKICLLWLGVISVNWISN